MVDERSVAPRRFAVVEETPDGARLVLVEIGTTEKHALPETDGEPRQPVWSPNGHELLYRIAGTLYWYRESLDSSMEVLAKLNAQAATPYAFSPDGQQIAASMLEEVAVFRTADLAHGQGAGRKVPVPRGCRMADLIWSPDGQRIVALCYPAPGTESAQVLEIEGGGSGPTKSGYVGPDLTRFLGWDRNGLLLAQKSGAVEEIVTLDAGTHAPQQIGALAEGDHLIAFLPGSNEIVTAKSSEDQGDPAIINILALGRPDPRRWLAAFPRLTDLSFSAKGSWAMFVNRVEDGGAGGDVYLVPAGQDAVQRVLRADPGRATYSAPVAWP